MARMTAEEIEGTIGELQRMIGSGVMSSTYAGRELRYNSIADMHVAIHYFERELTKAMPGEVAPAARSRTTYATFERD